MRILHVCRRYAPDISGGYEYNCQRFSEEWVKRHHAVTVLTRRMPSKQKTGTNVGGVRVLRNLTDIPPNRSSNTLSGRIYQSRIALANRRNKSVTLGVLRTWQPNVAIFWGMPSLLIAPILAARTFGIPCLFDLGDYWLSEALRIYSCADRLRRLYRRRVLLGGRFDASVVDAAVVHSHFMRLHYVDAGINPDKLLVVHRGVDETFLRVGAARSAPSTNRPLRILCVGRLVPDKGAMLLVQAFDQLQKVNADTELHFYGDPDVNYVRELERECKELELLNRKIFIHGRVPPTSMPLIYQTGDILAFPVLWDEPSSNVLLEAMAAGLPIVATRTGSNSEFVRHMETGFLVERGDSRALHEALRWLTEHADGRTYMGQAARKRVLQAYQQSDVYDRTAAWLQGVLGAINTRGVLQPH